METEKLEQQVASVERGMALLKREHLAMLAGLQIEISRLKRRCSELNCELDARFPAAEECVLVSRCQASERLLEQQACAGASVRAALRARQARAWALGRALRSDQRRFLEELKRRSHRITALGRELQRQTLTSTALGQRLYLQRGGLGEGDQCSGGARPEGPGRRDVPDEIEREEEWECDEVEEDEDEEDDGGEGSDALRPPARPDQSDELCARHVRVREQRVRACVPCERVTSPQKPQPMPDPALFLVPLRYRLLRWRRALRARSDPRGLQEEWEDLGTRGLFLLVHSGPMLQGRHYFVVLLENPCILLELCSAAMTTNSSSGARCNAYQVKPDCCLQPGGTRAFGARAFTRTHFGMKRFHTLPEGVADIPLKCSRYSAEIRTDICKVTPPPSAVPSRHT
ncbi:coiled-coil domain-containing 92B-like [Gadus macrocephalus]|uniref:coiled-coil domain-containing 92B-like n=1 Tax=Gadus macrocephalus TaxID=80720 RepID=UPI0028CB26B9|nr:coiled-coil domain-containing 92B-like [Gadus macrocephalus]